MDTGTIFEKLNQKVNDPKMTFDPTSVEVTCDSTQGSMYPSPMKIHQSMWIQWPFFSKTWIKGHWPLDDLWPQVCWCHMCDSTQGSLCPSPMKIHQSVWIQWPFFQKLEWKVIDPYMTFDPTSVEVTCVTLPKDHCVQVPWEYINVCGYSDQFCKIPHTTYHELRTYCGLRTEWVIT